MVDASGIPPVAGDTRHRQLSERVAEQIRESIMVGSLREGYLRTERLAEVLGVSQTPVREALMILHAEGTVRWEPRRGFRLIPLTARDVEDVYEVQATIAGELAARAAAVMSREDVARLSDLQDKLAVAYGAGDVAEVDRLNHELHRRINTASGSTKMTHLLQQTVRYVPLGFFGQIEGWGDASAHDHLPIIQALGKGSQPAARKAMATHIRHIGRLLLDHLRAQGVVD